MHGCAGSNNFIRFIPSFGKQPVKQRYFLFVLCSFFTNKGSDRPFSQKNRDGIIVVVKNKKEF